MKILMSPKVRTKNLINYEIEDNVITVTINDVTDVFDFSEMSDGELQLYDEDGIQLVETVLDEVPILGARKKSGVLHVIIKFSINPHEQDERLLFPEPMNLEEFNDLMAELAERQKEVESDGEDGLEE